MMSREKWEALKALFPGYSIDTVEDGTKITIILVPAHVRRVITPTPTPNPVAREVLAMLERMYDGDVPVVAENRTMWHCVTVEQEWTILRTDAQGTMLQTVNMTREQAEAYCREQRHTGLELTILEEW